MFRRRRITVAVAALLAIAGSYVGVVGFADLPKLPVTMTADAEASVEVDESAPQAAVAAQSRPTAVGWLDGEQVWSNDDEPHRIASLTKVITALVGLEAAPVEAGSDGPTYTLTWDDAAILDEILAEGGSFAPVEVGLELTTRQILDLILVPSANNYATTYARWVFGSDEAFLQAAADWLARHGLDSVRIFDATGMNDDNQATAADIVRLSRLALAHPLVAEIVAQSSFEVPAFGEITTTNRLLSEPGMLGIKTGTTFPEGYSLAAAQREDASGRELVAIAVVMDRADADDRATDARDALAAMAVAWQTVTLIEPGEEIGEVTTWQGEVVPLVTEAGAEVVLRSGEGASRAASLSEVTAGSASRSVGEVLVSAPTGDSEIAVVTSAAIETPDLWWRLTHPHVIYGWQPIEAKSPN
jgi:D-alanyl-D-alanine carboxypeptidase (penicillin-binding protein 5/6)